MRKQCADSIAANALEKAGVAKTKRHPVGLRHQDDQRRGPTTSLIHRAGLKKAR
jgi:hypothetical protein